MNNRHASVSLSESELDATFQKWGTKASTVLYFAGNSELILETENGADLNRSKARLKSQCVIASKNLMLRINWSLDQNCEL